jgi:hypothetical protein
MWGVQTRGTDNVLEVCKYLHVLQLDFTRVNSNGHSCVHKAAQRGNWDVCRWLLGGFLREQEQEQEQEQELMCGTKTSDSSNSRNVNSANANASGPPALAVAAAVTAAVAVAPNHNHNHNHNHAGPQLDHRHISADGEGFTPADLARLEGQY